MTQDELWAIFHDKGLSAWQIPKATFPTQISDAFFPEAENLFKALEESHPDQVKCLILGQDPYWTTSADGVPDATGVAFAVPIEADIPPSLNKILSKIGSTEPDLVSWRRKHGVLLLNAALTVPRPMKEAGKYAGAHLRHWEPFMVQLIATLKQRCPNVMLIAWGSKPRDLIHKALQGLPSDSQSFLWCYHPQARFMKKNNPNGFDQFWERDEVKHLRC